MTATSRSLSLAAILLANACSPSQPNVGEHGSEGVGYASPAHVEQVAQIDEIMMAPIREGQIAGASIAVVHRGEMVATRGYGWGEMELAVPTPVDAIYETGSITKQFTSVALLQMQEQGALALDDDIAAYLPDFPTQGNRITVRELLDHTSGIHGYTEMADAMPYFVRRVPRDTLVALVAGKPFTFPTGEHLIYNNSAYFLAGMVLEQVADVSYEEYVEERIFAELDMEHSHYCSEVEIHPGKVKGYDVGEDGLRHKGFIVHNVPFAAGSICSSAGDLALWLMALHGGRVLTEESYKQLVEPGDLNDGTKTRYALGLATSDVMGHAALHHGGGIPGFLSESLYLTDEELAVVVLVNTAGPPGPTALAQQIVGVMVGDATPEPEVFEGDLARFEGSFGGPARGGEMVFRIVADGADLTATVVTAGGLELPEERQEAVTLDYRGGTTFSNGNELFTFEMEGGSSGDAAADGMATRLRWDSVAGYSMMARR